MDQYTGFGATASARTLVSSACQSLPRSVDETWLDSCRESSTVWDGTLRFGSPWKRTTAQTAGILVVDDDPHIRAIVTRILVLEGYVVWRATNGLEGLRVLDEVRPALALLDMRMPAMNGWEFARALRERCLRLPMLVMTAALDGRRWADEIGAAGCVTKPFDQHELLAEVERLAPT